MEASCCRAWAAAASEARAPQALQGVRTAGSSEVGWWTRWTPGQEQPPPPLPLLLLLILVLEVEEEAEQGRLRVSSP